MWWRASNYQQGLAFFGLSPEYKNIVLEEVHALCYYGNGGFTHSEAYSMPIRYRHYHLKKIANSIETQNKSMSGNKEMTEDTTLPSKIQPPDFITKVKAPKKQGAFLLIYIRIFINIINVTYIYLVENCYGFVWIYKE